MQHGESIREGGEKGKEKAAKDRKVGGSQISVLGKGRELPERRGRKGYKRSVEGIYREDVRNLKHLRIKINT